MAAPIFESIQNSPLGLTIAESTWLFPTLETLHVFALAVVIGTIFIVDLRLLSLASKTQRVTAISNTYLPWTWGAFGLAAVTGLLLFTSRAADYMVLKEFISKFVVMGLAGVNMAFFHFTTYKTVEAWDTGVTPSGAKIAAGLSLLFWTLIILLGRKVGFVL